MSNGHGSSGGAAGAGARRAAGELESEVLAALWAAGRAQTPGEVHASLGEGVAYNTVLTILVRLHEKGLVSRQRIGRSHAYLPTVEHAQLAAARMRSVLDAGTDQEAVLQRFVADLSDAEAAALRRLLLPGPGAAGNRQAG